MRTAFIEVTGTKQVKLSKDMKGKVGIVATTQYLHQIKELQKKIPNSVLECWGKTEIILILLFAQSRLKNSPIWFLPSEK